MRPMTAREALEIERRGSPVTSCGDKAWAEYDQARRILDALVELRMSECAHSAFCFSSSSRSDAELHRLTHAMFIAESKLAALERGEEPKE